MGAVSRTYLFGARDSGSVPRRLGSVIRPPSGVRRLSFSGPDIWLFFSSLTFSLSSVSSRFTSVPVFCRLSVSLFPFQWITWGTTSGVTEAAGVFCHLAQSVPAPL